jgi:lipoprotein-anchoring transpeptidase ErfK/SrfK
MRAITDAVRAITRFIQAMPRQRLTLLAGLSAAVVVGLTVGAYAYDSSREDLIADGVKVAGLDIGGLDSSEARRKLSAELTGRLDRSVRVKAAGRRFRLTPEAANLAVDVDGMVDEAIERSRSGGLPGRLWRSVTGSNVDADLEARVGYSSIEVRRFARRVKRSVDRRPRDADVEFRLASLPAVPSRTGLTVNYKRVLARVESALNGIGSARTVRIDVKVVQPKVTTRELARKYPVVITIDRPAFTLRLFKRLKMTKSYRIAVGQIGLETPAGLYHVENKAVNPSWHVPNSAWAGSLAGTVVPPGPSNPIKSRWLGIYAGAGIHGTVDVASLGTAASHGCIRMSIPDVEELYDQVPVQTPVFVQ